MSTDRTSTHRIDTASRLRRTVTVAAAILVGGATFGLPGSTAGAAALGHDVGLSTGDPAVVTRTAVGGVSVSGGDRTVVVSWPRQRVKGLRISLRGHRTGRGGRVLPKWAKWGQAKPLRPQATRYAFKGLRNGREYQVKLDVKRGRKWRTFASGIAVAKAPRFTPGPISLISTSSSGAIGNRDSEGGAISGDGRKVMFTSLASNLVAGDTNGSWDIFVKDLATGATTRVSTATDGTQANGDSSSRYYGAAFSPDGSKVAFGSNASNLVPGDANGAADIFVKSLNTGFTQRISTTAAGAEGNSASVDPVFSPDGTKIAFGSHASNLVPGDTDGSQSDIFVKDLGSGVITEVSDPSGGCAYRPVFSPDGTTIVFTQVMRDDVALILRSLGSGRVLRVTSTGAGGRSVFSPDGTTVAHEGLSGIQIIQLSSGATSDVIDGDDPAFSPDGHELAYSSEQVHVKDLRTGAVRLVSTSASGEPSRGAGEGRFSPDGTRVIFSSGVDNLVPKAHSEHGQIFIKTIA